MAASLVMVTPQLSCATATTQDQLGNRWNWNRPQPSHRKEVLDNNSIPQLWSNTSPHLRETGREMKMIFIFDIEEMRYFIAHYITVTNSEHACAAFPIIDYKQLHWR